MKAKIVTERELGRFRAAQLNPRRLLSELARHHRLYIKGVPGIGKSVALRQLLSTEATYQSYDVVLLVIPQWLVLDEYKIDSIPVKAFVMEPRPRSRCGPDRDKLWTRAGELLHLQWAKSSICGGCPNNRSSGGTCSWPHRYQDLADAKPRIVVVTEELLRRVPAFPVILRSLVGAERMLIVLDEALMAGQAMTKSISRRQVGDFTRAVTAAAAAGVVGDEVAAATQRFASVLVSTPAAIPKWRGSARLLAANAGQLQAFLEHAGGSTPFLGYDFLQMTYSEPSAIAVRRSHIEYLAAPYLGCDLVIASAFTPASFFEYRLGVGRIHELIADIVLRHTGTRFYNIQSSLGAAKYYGRNRPQILDVFARLIHDYIGAGRSICIVSKKEVAVTSAAELKQRLADLGSHVDFVHAPFKPETEIAHPICGRIPVLTYGIYGSNLFQDYDVCLCLNSYYRSTSDLQDLVTEGVGSMHAPTIRVVEGGGGRTAVSHGANASSAWDDAADAYLTRLETAVVLQAVGRVRPFTRERVVITFQNRDLTAYVGPHTAFSNLAEVRAHFGLEGRGWGRDADKLLALLSAGRSVAEAAKELGWSRAWAYRVRARLSTNPMKENIHARDRRQRR